MVIHTMRSFLRAVGFLFMPPGGIFRQWCLVLQFEGFFKAVMTLYIP